jgi:hypothetical protein
MLTVGFRDLKESATDLRDKQAVRRPYYLTASVPVPNNGRAKATLVCDEDADIYIMGLTGSIVAPANVDGVRNVSFTSFPMPGMLTDSEFACGGLQLRIYASSDKEDTLSDPEIFFDARNILQPGYAIGRFARPYPFSRYLKRGDKLTFEFLNLDTGDLDGNTFHYVSLTLTCRKYDPFTR